jgi:aminoglycoside phosphotransferase (APT) family kinase protein
MVRRTYFEGSSGTLSTTAKSASAATEIPWAADIHVDRALATALIGSQFPELLPKKVEPFGAGWDNVAFLADGKVVFRFPRRRIVTKLLEREIALLPQIAGALPLRISAPTFVGVATPAFPWKFAGYPVIEGTTVASLGLSDAERSRLAEPLGVFLRALHGIDPAPLVALGLPPDEIGRLDADKFLRVEKRVPSLATAGVEEAQPFIDWLAAHLPVPIAAEKRTLVHGDLYAPHVVLDNALLPAGVIDWGDIHLGDPALDLAVAHLLLPAGAHHAFRDAYGAIDERTWQAARYRAIYHAILEVDYGVREKNRGLRQSGADALRLLRDGL